MRVHFQTHKPNEPLYFGFDPTPNFATFSLVEPQILFLSKGLRLVFRGQEAVVQGGPELEIALKIERKSSLNEDHRLAELADLAERTVNAEIMAIQNSMPEMGAIQPLLAVFRTEDRLISAEMVAEELLTKMQALRSTAFRKLRQLYGVNDRACLETQTHAPSTVPAPAPSRPASRVLESLGASR